MRETVSDFLIRRLGQWGIRRIYGFPGDGSILPTQGSANPGLTI